MDYSAFVIHTHRLCRLRLTPPPFIPLQLLLVLCVCPRTKSNNRIKPVSQPWMQTPTSSFHKSSLTLMTLLTTTTTTTKENLIQQLRNPRSRAHLTRASVNNLPLSSLGHPSPYRALTHGSPQTPTYSCATTIVGPSLSPTFLLSFPSSLATKAVFSETCLNTLGPLKRGVWTSKSLQGHSLP